MTSSSKNSQKLKLDFYESGLGETIVITFPSGGIGLIDAHPSKHAHRPPILEIVKDKTIHFVCLTHPHADHGVDLVPVLNEHHKIESFWHTVYHIPALIYGVEQMDNFPSEIRGYAKKMNEDWGRFLRDIFGAVADRDISTHELRSNITADVIDGVELHCLSPEESVQASFFKAYQKKLENPETPLPDPNLLSAVLALKFGESVVIFGADALKENWETALANHHKRKLPKAVILKVPHHGARNAIDLRNKARTYLDICAPKAKSVVFAGDAKHPDNAVFEKIWSRTETICTSNGLKRKSPAFNPLNLQLPGATAVFPAPVCNPVVSFEIGADGTVSRTTGNTCQSQCLQPKPPDG